VNRTALITAMILAGLVDPLSCQLTEEVLRSRIDAATPDASAEVLLQASDAARLLRDYDQAASLLDRATEAAGDAKGAILWSRLSLELASGGGVAGAKRAVREAYGGEELPPADVAYWVNNFPVLLTGGDFHGVVEKFAVDAEDPAYRCACYSQKAWMHRAAGHWDEAVVYWDSAVAMAEANPAQSEDPDVLADTYAQYARNYARAGRDAEARQKLEAAMAMPVSDEAAPRVRRRWAQAYAELGDAEKAVEQLEYLLSVPSLITVHTLESRMAWEPIRDDPAFQALLDRYR
jgi:tetratricopeptide (TPR) repeat protein